MNKLSAQIKPWIKKHARVIIFALLVGALSVLPHLLAERALGAAYQGIPFFYLNNEDYYLARVNEIHDGHYLVNSPYFYEYKDIMQVVPPTGEYLYIFLGFITGASPPNTLIIAKFLFPAILFVLVYVLIVALTKVAGRENEVRWGAIAGALMVALGSELVDYHLLFQRLAGEADPLILSVWTRPVNPITGALFLFAFLNLLWLSIQKTSWKYIVCAGIMLGFSMGYIFSFTLGFATLGVLFVFAFASKEYATLKKIIIIGSAGLVLPILYWINVFPQLAKTPGLAERNGLLLTHALLPNKVLLAATAVLGLLLFYAGKKGGVNVFKDHKQYLPLWFSSLLLVAGLFALNQQVVTGRAIWPYHFVQYTIPFAMIALYVAMFFLLRPFAPKMWKTVIASSIILVILFASWNVSTYVLKVEDFKKLQDFAPIFAWLNANASKDCVVLVSEDETERLIGLIPGFTSCNVYTTNYLGGSVPMTRAQHNFFVKLRLMGITDRDIDQFLAEKNGEMVKMYFYKDWIELLSNDSKPRINAIIPGLAMEYREFVKKDFEEELQKYRIDYIISRGDFSSEARQALPRLSPVFVTGSTTIYELK